MEIFENRNLEIEKMNLTFQLLIETTFTRIFSNIDLALKLLILFNNSNIRLKRNIRLKTCWHFPSIFLAKSMISTIAFEYDQNTFRFELSGAIEILSYTNERVFRKTWYYRLKGTVIKITFIELWLTRGLYSIGCGNNYRLDRMINRCRCNNLLSRLLLL